MKAGEVSRSQRPSSTSIGLRRIGLNLAARDTDERDLVARRLFACVARSLAVPIAAAVK